MLQTIILGVPLVEWIGYTAPLLIAVSLLMSSIIKLRWLNLFGGAVFALYGILIGSLPVAFMNGFIAVIDIYFLIKIYRKRDYFQLLEVSSASAYLQDYLHFYREDINRFFPRFEFRPSEHAFQFFVLRDMVPAGVVIGDKTEEKTIRIDLDFASPAYRDLRTGSFFLDTREPVYRQEGFQAYETWSDDAAHDKYLKRLGFRMVQGEEGRRLFRRDFSKQSV